MSRSRPFKRAFDVLAAAAALGALAPLMAVVAAAVKLDSPGPVLFRQTRMGRGYEPFRIMKFRTMTVARSDVQITTAGDARITRVGKLIRGSRLDELPQLFNVLRGQMSIVGPRPEVPKYADVYRDAFRALLTDSAPGLTDPATLEFRNEAELLVGTRDPEETYLREILPRKLALSSEYAGRATFVSDLIIIARTAKAVLGR